MGMDAGQRVCMDNGLSCSDTKRVESNVIRVFTPLCIRFLIVRHSSILYAHPL